MMVGVMMKGKKYFCKVARKEGGEGKEEGPIIDHCQKEQVTSLLEAK